MRRASVFTSLAALACGAIASSASAAPTLRIQVDQHGDFLQIGNTLGFECAAGTPAPVVGTVTGCNQSVANVGDSAPDLLWVSDSPAAGQASAAIANTPAQARSTAVLTIPPGATVTNAFLYWAAESPTGTADTTVTVARPGVFSTDVAAIQSFTPGVNNTYQSVADITTLVQTRGSGAYRVSGIDVIPFANVNNNNAFGGWSMVVFYQLATDPLRNITIFDGLDVVSNGANQTANLSGFLVPNAGFTGKLGIITYEGDNAITGDQLFFGGGAALSNALNPADNFFNGSRTNLGAAVSVAGDLPQLTGGPQSMAGMDLDIVDVTSKLTAGQTSATVQATSTGDVYYLGAFITSISTFRPDFNTSGKAAVDVNGGTLLPGDQIQYTINVINTGNDASINTVLTDPLPPGVAFVPGSIQITAGANAGAKTDAVGDDQGEYNAGTNSVVVRLGTGANGTNGGSIPIAGTATVTFRVQVNANFIGTIDNQAIISAAGLLGSPTDTTPTDGNGPASGSPPTTVTVDQCGNNSNCSPPTPVCNIAPSPHVCVGCLTDPDCGGPTSGQVCNAATLTCVPGCRGTNGNGCDPASTNNVCTSVDNTIGQCVDCLKDGDCGGLMSGTVCNAANDTCQPGCRGMGGNGCMANLACTSMDTTIGQCVGCVIDANCGSTTSGQVCDTAAHMCIAGCRGMGGNGCNPASMNDQCTSTDNTIGQCVDCKVDSDCGGPTSAKVCDTTNHTCIAGCHPTGNSCDPNAMGMDVCTSSDATIGQCVDCNVDPDCGGPESGKVCDASVHMCIDGCRGTGNHCIPSLMCTSMDDTIGQCVMSSGTGTGSGGAGGNGTGSMSTGSGTNTGTGSASGGAGSSSGGAGGNASKNVFAEGNGIFCATIPAGRGDADGLWLLAAAGLGVVARRRRSRG